MTTKKKKVEENKDSKSFVHFDVNEDGSVIFKCNANDKQLLALMLVIYKNLDDDAKKTFAALIRTVYFLDKLCEV